MALFTFEIVVEIAAIVLLAAGITYNRIFQIFTLPCIFVKSGGTKFILLVEVPPTMP